MYGSNGIRIMSRTNAATRYPAACNVKGRCFSTSAHAGCIGRESEKSERAAAVTRHAACTDDGALPEKPGHQISQLLDGERERSY